MANPSRFDGFSFTTCRDSVGLVHRFQMLPHWWIRTACQKKIAEPVIFWNKQDALLSGVDGVEAYPSPVTCEECKMATVESTAQSQNDPAPQGWICPRCHKVWGPSVKQCECAPEWEELRK